MVSRLLVVRNVLKAWALLAGACAVFALIGWALGGYRLLSIFVFCGALLFVLGPLAAAIMHLLLSPKREFAADRAAAALCGSPHGLADALIRLEQAAELVEFRANPATEPLYTFNPALSC